MPVPNSQEIRKPLLEIFKNEVPRNLLLNEFLEIIAEYFGKNPDNLSSDDKNILKDNITQAEKYLIENQLLACPVKNTYFITWKGLEVLAQNPQVIDDDFLVNMSGEKIMEEPEQVEEEFSDEKPEEPPEILPEEEPEQTDNFENPLEVFDEETEEAPEPLPDEEPEQIENFDEIETEEPSEILPDEEPEHTDNFDDIETEEAPEILPEEEPEQTDNFENPLEVFDEEPEESPEILPDEELAQTDNFDDVEDEEPSEILPDEEPAQIENFDDDVEVKDEFSDEEPEPETTEIENENENEPEESEPENENENEEENFTQSDDIQEVLSRYNSDLADEVLGKIDSISQEKFGMLIMDFLSKMGYFAFRNARYTTEASGNELIQGVIIDDKADGKPIYIRAKKSFPGKIIERSEMENFIEALSDKSRKGVFATMANFSEGAEELARKEGIMLLDGKKLAALMIENNFGVNVEKIFEFKTIDNDTLKVYEE